jgi:hypothetical protein
MSGPGSSGRARRFERGGISWVTLVLLAALAAGAYLAWVWGPVYFELYTVKQVVRDYMNQAIKNRDDGGLRRNMVTKLRSLQQLESVDARGLPVLVPAVSVEEADVAWERGEDGGARTLHVAFAYERLISYPLVGWSDVRIFEVDLTGDLTPPDWGPAR